jgi:beta-lactamase regulating signal transducer with metallopeptidase domain/HEAT repeat protein
VLPQSLQTSASASPADQASHIRRAEDGTASVVTSGTAGAASATVEDAGSTSRVTAPVTPLAESNLAGASAPAPSRWSTGLIVALVWAGGVVVFLGWLLHGQLTVRRIVRQAPPMNSDEWRRALWEVADRLDLDQVPLLLQSERTHMPFASGFLKPVIVLPSDAESWSADRRAAVLLHELAHVRRKDLFGHTLGRVACAIYWFHPLVWAAAKRLRVESERACDDFAITCGARASDYAEHLLDIVTAVRKQMTPAVAMAMAHRKEFEGRMLAILDPEVPRARPSRRQAVLSVAGLAALSLVVAAAAPATPPAPAAAAVVAQQDSSGLEADTGAVATIDDRSDEQRRQRRAGRQEEQPIQLPQLGNQPSVSTQSGAAPQGAQAPEQANTQVNTQQSFRQVEQPAQQSGWNVTVDNLYAQIASALNAPQGQSQGDDRAKLLMQVLRTDSSANLRRIAAWGLGQIERDKAATDALSEALRRDRDADVREMAAWALGEGDDDSGATEALMAAMRGDADMKVRQTSAWAIGQLGGGSSALAALSEAARSNDARLRSIAIWAIGQMEPQSAPREVVNALADSSKRVRLLAAWALFQIEDPEAAPALERALDRETDKDLQRAYIRALAATGERSADVLSKLIGSNDPEVRAIAVRALAGSGNGTGPWPWPWPQPRPNP